MDKKIEFSNLKLDKIISTGEVSPVTTLAIMINNKQDKLNELKAAVNSELSLKLTYLHKSNAVRLDPDLKDTIGLSKNPTEKQVQAYIENTYEEDYQLMKIAEENTKLIKRQLELIDDRISLEKYAIRLELKE